MAGKREKPKETVSKIQQFEVLQGEGATVAEAVRQIGMTQQTIYRWRKLHDEMFDLFIKISSFIIRENSTSTSPILVAITTIPSLHCIATLRWYRECSQLPQNYI